MTSRRPSLEELAAGEIDAVDVELLHRVGGIHDTLDPVPAGLVDRIRFGITLDALQAEIAELQRTGDLAGVRSDDTTETQTVTFTSATMTTMVTITRSAVDLFRIDGWVVPGGGVSVEIRLREDVRQTVADSDGRFVFQDVPRGLAQFVLRPPTQSQQPTVVTPAIEIR